MLNPLVLAAAPLALAACIVVVDATPDDGEFGIETSFAGQDREGRRAEAGEVLAAEATLDPFTIVEASAGVEVIVAPGDAYTISLDDDARRRASYAVEDGTLEVTCRKRRGWGGNCLRGDRGTLTVTLPRAEALRASSGAALTLREGVALGDALSLRASSGAVLRAAGTRVAELDARASSGASLDARGIEAERASADASSGASVRLGTIRATLDAEASSGASVSYAGTPQVDRRASSGGSVSGR